MSAEKTMRFRRYENLLTEPLSYDRPWSKYFLSPWEKYLESYKTANDWIESLRPPQPACETMLGFREMTREEKDAAYRKLLDLRGAVMS